MRNGVIHSLADRSTGSTFEYCSASGFAAHSRGSDLGGRTKTLGGGGVGGGRKKDALAPGKALMRTNAAVISESCSGRDWSLHLLPALLRVADAQHPMGAGET